MSRGAVGLLGLFGVCGCGEPAAPADPLVPTPWVYDDPGTPDRPELSASDIEGELAGLVTFLRETDPLFIFAAMDDGFRRFGGDCPSVDTHNGQIFVQGNCTTASGDQFLGYSLGTQTSGPISLDGEPATEHRNFSWTTGNLEIHGADGYELGLLGDCEYHDYDTVDGDPAFGLYLWGDFYLHDGVTTNWLADDIGVHLYLDAVDHPEGRSVGWSGGASRLGGLTDAFSLEDFVIAETGTCGAVEPSGEVWFWDTNLYWYEVVFDDTCDGCGDVRVDGTSIGSACADWSPLIDWESRPW
jgi:hypothetical protein